MSPRIAWAGSVRGYGVRRMLGLVAATMVAVAALTGCGSGPNEGTSAVIIGDTAVPLSVVQDRITALLSQPERLEPILLQGAQTSDIARFVANRSAVHLLATEAAKRDGIGVGPNEVDAVIAAEQRLGVERLVDRLETPEMVHERAYDELVLAEVARRQLDRLSVTYDRAIVRTRAEAEQLAARAVRGDPAATRTFALAGSVGMQARAAENPRAADAVWFGTPAGRVFYAQPVPGQGAWLVVRVTERNTAAPTTATSAAPSPSATPPAAVPPGATPPAPAAAAGPPASVAATLDPASLQRIGIRLLQPLAEELNLRVNPRYGAWDLILMELVPADAVTGRILHIAAPR